MELHDNLKEKLHHALLDAYRSRTALKRMVDFQLKENLRSIAGEGILEDVAYELIDWFDAKGKLEKLIEGAYKDRPEHQGLKSIYQEFLPPQPSTDTLSEIISPEQKSELKVILSDINFEILQITCRATLKSISKDIEEDFPQMNNEWKSLRPLQEILLEKSPLRKDKIPTIIEFAERLTQAKEVHEYEKISIQKWLEKMVNEKNISLPTYVDKPQLDLTKIKPHLLIIIEQLPENFRLQAELISNHQQGDNRPEYLHIYSYKDELICSFDEIKNEIFNFIEKAKDEINKEHRDTKHELTIELINQVKYSGKDFDLEKIDLALNELKPIKYQYQLAVSYLEQDLINQYTFGEFLNEFLARWDLFKAFLKENSTNEQDTQSLIKASQNSEETGIYTEIAPFLQAQESVRTFLQAQESVRTFLQAQGSTVGAATTLSNFLKFHLENCDYTGVEAVKKQSKNFTERDLEQLISDEKGLGIKRPREQASYYLSAAKILIDLGSKAEEKRPRIYLRNFCAAMGDAYIAEKQNNDVVRSYYAEAFLIAPKWVEQLDVKMSQYIMLYYSSPDELLKPKLPPIESCLKEAISMNLGKLVIEGLLYLSWLNSEVSSVLINKIYLDRNLRELVQSLCYEILGEKGRTSTDKTVFVKLWGCGQELMGRQHQEIVDELAALHSLANNLDDLLEQIKKIQELREKFRLELDKKRLDKIKKIVTDMHDYSQHKSYTEQELYVAIINNNITQLSQEIEQSPTQDSWKFLFPYLSSLETTINQHFQKIQQAAEPESLTTQSSTKLPDTEDLDCQITISNESGKSPASSIKIEVLESTTQRYKPKEKSISITEALPGGKSITCQIPVRITEIAQEAKAFTLHYKLSHTTRTGRQVTAEYKDSIQLYSAKDFQEINNPYGSYAQGNIVRDEKMFYGRDHFINNLISSIRNAYSAKSFVVYGQKRTGKSSILYHLQQNLNLPIIPVIFSIGGTELSDATFLYKIIREIEGAFDELAEQGYPSIDIQRPDIEKMQNNAKIIFEDYMYELQKSLRKIDEYRNTRIMLLIDEFSYIYLEIQRGNVQDSFMQFWKALLEKNYFGTVLVGQDYMPRLINRFPNEFSIMESQRISYLEKDSARNLIINPILAKEEKSRYTGEAVNKLIDLTAGSPYYIQIFCNRLVDYMNRKKIMYVTDADIERVKEELITGNNSLDSAVFDNLTSAGDEHTDDISKEDAEAVLRDIAKETHLQPYCDRSSITTETLISSIDEVLKDLETREVIEKQGASGYRIKVGLFKEWLLAHQ